MRCYSHLSDDEREQIGLAKAVGHSIGAIAKAMAGRSRRSRAELSRNKLPSGRYSPLHAAGAYQLRRRREARIRRDRALRTFVVDRLAEGGPGANFRLAQGRKRTSPAGRGLRDDLRLHLQAAQQAEQLWRYLTRHHKRRRPRRSRPSQDTIKDRVSIHERPKHVEARTEGGHWEGDLIICKRTRPVLVLHERKSRVTLAARLAGKTAAETISVMLAVFARVDPPAQAHHFRQRYRLRPARLAANHARHDHLVLRRLCLVAKGRGQNARRPTTTLVASSDRHRQSVRRGNPGHRHDRQSHAQKMPGLQDPSSGNPQRAWQRRANPLCIALLHLAPESRAAPKTSAKNSPLAAEPANAPEFAADC